MISYSSQLHRRRTSASASTAYSPSSPAARSVRVVPTLVIDSGVLRRFRSDALAAYSLSSSESAISLTGSANAPLDGEARTASRRVSRRGRCFASASVFEEGRYWDHWTSSTESCEIHRHARVNGSSPHAYREEARIEAFATAVDEENPSHQRFSRLTAVLLTYWLKYFSVCDSLADGAERHQRKEGTSCQCDEGWGGLNCNSRSLF